MLSSTIRHGLKRSSCVAAFYGQRLPLSTTRPRRARRSDSDKSVTPPAPAARKVKREDPTDLFLLASSGFEGFPHLEASNSRKEKQHNDQHGERPPREARSPSDNAQPRKERIDTSRDVGSGSIEESTARSTTYADPSEGNGEDGDKVKDAPGHEEKHLPAESVRERRTSNSVEPYLRPGEITHEQLMRPMQKPKRFLSLLRETRPRGENNPRGHLDPRTGKIKKILTRNVLSTELLEAELRWVARNAPAPRAVGNILRILIQERGIKPTPSHYEALILGQCHPEFGSVENVKITLQGLEQEGIPLEAPILFAALTVLSVHPDMYLRSNIIERLARQQIAVPDAYAHFNILALIREEQLEMATIELERLSQRNQGTPIPSWLWTTYIHAICDVRQDFDALLQLLYRLSDSGFLFPRPTLLHLLQKASEAGDINVTKFIWHRYVEAMHVIPNEELCMSVLRVAAKEHDLKLAESVAVVLESVAGNTMTDPPCLKGQEPWLKHKVHSLAVDSPGMLDVEDNQLEDISLPGDIDHMAAAPDNITPSTWKSFKSTTIDNPIEPPSDDDLARSMSTPPSLPGPGASPPPPRPLPFEALHLLADLEITGFDPNANSPTQAEAISWLGDDHTKQVAEQTRTRRRRRRPVKGILYPLFREEAGLAGARFDPRLALLTGWDWRGR